MAARLAAVLRAKGAKVVMTRTSNSGVGPCINQRAAIGNAAHASAVLSIHGDGNLTAGARGFQIIVANRMVGGSAVQRASQALADDVRTAFRSGTGMPYSDYTGGGTAETHRSDIGGLNLSTRPAVMIETGNMRSSVDAALMTSASFRQKEAVALAAGSAFGTSAEPAQPKVAGLVLSQSQVWKNAVRFRPDTCWARATNCAVSALP